MTPCPDKEPLLHALLDGELDAVNTVTCEAHLRTCSSCAAELERLQSLRAALRAPGVHFRAPGSVKQRIEAALAVSQTSNSAAVRTTPTTQAGRSTSAGPRPGRAWSWLQSWTVGAAATALAAACAWLVLFYLPPPSLTDELVASHVRSLLATHLTDVQASDRHVVKPWFNGKVDFAPPVVELADAGFPLAGGRLDYIHGRVVAALVYRRRQHIINVFAWPARGAGPVSVALRRDGYSLVHWSQGGLQLWAVSDLDSGELQAFRAAFAQRARP